MKLTIGMIVKNEEMYLDRCLSSIKPILDKVDSELIITDTGSTDNTIEIAKKYTDNVLCFEWINDFAAARNTGIKSAQGEWFMFLDADEIFRSCEGIIEFFNSDEYKKYNSATYVIHSLYSSGESSDFNAQRLTKLTPETHFEGIVHELFNTYGTPVKHLNDVADHYGYIYSDKEKAAKKSRRNIELLQKKLSIEKKTDPIIYVQLYDSYMVTGDRENADKYMRSGIEYCHKNKSLVLAVLYVKKAYDEVCASNYNDAIKTCLLYLNMDKDIRQDRLSADKEIFAILASSYLRTKQEVLAEQAFMNFFDVCELVDSGKLYTPDADAIMFRASADSNYLPFVNAFLHCCITNEHYENAVSYMRRLPIYKYSQYTDALKETIAFEIVLLEKAGWHNFDAFYDKLDNQGKELLSRSAESLKHKKDAMSEMDKLALQIKRNIRNFIASGNIDAARKTIDEYSKINPGDQEIKELLEMLK